MTNVVFEREPGASDRPNFAMPKPIGRAMVVLALLTLGVAAYSRATGRTAAVADFAPAIASRDLILRDLPSGGMEVRDGRTGELLSTMASPDSARFLRTVVRGLGDRVDPRDATLEVMFTLSLREDGQLTITRRGSDRVNAVNGFGVQQVSNLQELLRKR
jgi:hypothetical protein